MEFDTQITKAFSLYYERDFAAARLVFEELMKDVVNDDNRNSCLLNIASCFASQGDLDRAMKIISDINIPDNCLLYNKALCQFLCGNFKEAISYLDQIIECCERASPQLFKIDEKLHVPCIDRVDGSEIFEKLQESCLIEAINLKSASLYKLSGDPFEAKQILSRIPIKSQDLLDCVTLHNQAIYEYQSNSHQSIKKISHLVQLRQSNTDVGNYVPSQVNKNFISLCLNANGLDIASEFMQTNKDQIESSSTKEQLEYFEIQLERPGMPDDIFHNKLDQFLDKLLKTIKIGSESDDHRFNSRFELHKLTELAMLVVANQSSILWCTNQYKRLEKLLLKVKFIFSDHMKIWTKNMAHVLFMLDTRFEECNQMYENFLPKNDSESLFNIDPVILSNLCVSYVLTGRNGEAEELIKEIEEEEESRLPDHENDAFFHTTRNHKLDSSVISNWLSRLGPVSSNPPTHLSIINLAIETLYCVKNNYEFGLTRMFKTLEPIERKLNHQVWFHVKRCILSLLDNHCKQLIYIRDDLFSQIVSFLVRCEKFGISGPKVGFHPQSVIAEGFNGQNCVTYEARYLRSIMLTVIHD